MFHTYSSIIIINFLNPKAKMKQIKTILFVLGVSSLLLVATARNTTSVVIEENTEIITEPPGPANPESQAMMDSIYQRYDEFKSLKVNMVLTTGYKDNIAIDTIHGFMDGAKYRLEMPHQDVVHDGKKVWFYNKKSKKLFSELNNPKEANFIYPVNTIKTWENAFNYSIVGELELGENTFVKMSFTPKESKYAAPDSPQINLFVDKQNFQILKITFLQPNGYIHMLDYLDFEPNLKFDPSIFVMDIS